MRCAMRCVHTVSPSCCCLGGMSWFVSARSLVRWWRKLWQAGTAVGGGDVFFTERRHSEHSGVGLTGCPRVGLTGCCETPPIAQAEVRFECPNCILVRRRSRFLAALKARLGLIVAKTAAVTTAAMRVMINATGCPAPVSDRASMKSHSQHADNTRRCNSDTEMIVLQCAPLGSHHFLRPRFAPPWPPRSC